MPDFSQWFLVLMVWVIAYYAIVVVHETGHYLAGLMVGIPRREMKMVLRTFPQHVALRDGERWVSPVETGRYVELAERFMPTTGKALVFVAGGFVVETLFLLTWAALRLPCYSLVVRFAFAMTLLYLIADGVTFVRTRRAGMDFSALCSISPVWGGLLVGGIVGGQVLMVLFF